MIQFRREWITNIEMMQQEVNRLLDYFSGSKPPTIRFSSRVWEPAIDLYETDDALIVTVELAGVRESEMEIQVERNTFTIRGERRKPLPAGGRGAYFQMEIASGPFERTITLPMAIDAAGARASYGDGLVEVILPKVKEKRTVRVEVKASQKTTD